MTGLVTPHRWREVSRTSIEAILGAARLCSRYTVVDVAATSLEKRHAVRIATTSPSESWSAQTAW